MYEGYSKIFWGIFIATFNISLGAIKILPRFIGLLIISRGLRMLYEETKLKSFYNAHTMCILATSISLIYINFTKDSLNSSIFILILGTTYNVVELILFFKTLEAAIEYLDSNNYCELANENILKLRIYTIFSVINIIFMNFALLFNFSKLIDFSSFIGVSLRIFMMVLINRLKKLFVETEPVN